MAPNFYPRSSVDEPTNRTGLNVRFYCAMLVLATLGLAARVASKRLKRNHMMIDDYLILWAYVRSCARCFLTSLNLRIDTCCCGDRHAYLWQRPQALVRHAGEVDYDIAIQHAAWGRHLATLDTSEVIAFGKVGPESAHVFVDALTLLRCCLR